MAKVAPEFVSTKVDIDCEWHHNAFPLFIKKANESLWLFVSFATFGDSGLVFKTAAWSDQARIPENPKYLEDGEWPNEGFVHLRNGLVTGFPVPEDDLIFDLRKLRGVKISRPSRAEREAQADLQLSNERTKKAIRKDHRRAIKRNEFQGSYDEFFAAERADLLQELELTWNVTGNLKPANDELREAIAEESANSCMKDFTKYVQPLFARIEKQWPGPYKPYVPSRFYRVRNITHFAFRVIAYFFKKMIGR